MAANVELQMPFDGIYQPALSIPVDTCQRFSRHPLTWLRYIGFTIYGRKGYISTSPGGPEVEYYQADIKPAIYYYVSQEGFLLDPDLMDDRTSDGSNVSITSSQVNFRDKMIDRDGKCVMTGTTNVQAAHIVPHAKGNQYMIKLATHRHEPGDPALNDIDDPRNGILLSVALHKPFGDSQIGFLRTPNFAMTVNDVDLAMQPNPGPIGFVIQPSDADKRLTLQHFKTPDSLTAFIVPHNCDARITDSDEWPPPLIFDAAYGCSALKTWGVPQFMDFARECTRDIYYNHGGNGDDENGDGKGGDEVSGDGQKVKRSQKGRDPNARASRRHHRKASNAANSPVSEIADLVIGLWMHNDREGQLQAQAMKAARTREKVQTWLDSAAHELDVAWHSNPRGGPVAIQYNKRAVIVAIIVLVQEDGSAELSLTYSEIATPKASKAKGVKSNPKNGGKSSHKKVEPNNTMVHPTVFNPDIFSIICQFLPRKSLSTLARTAKVLQDPALRELWRSITRFSHLLFPFGSSLDRTGEKMYFSNAPTSPQWDRFRFYAQYVRNVQIGYTDDIELSSLSMLLCHQPILPRLKSLRVTKLWPNSALSALVMFFGPSMKEFAIMFPQEDLLNMDSLIATLAITTPALQDLAITVLAPSQRGFGASISSFQKLSSISVRLAGLQVHCILSHLSTLPSLSEITFTISSAAPLGTCPKYLFHAARNLHVRGHEDASIVQFMAITQFDNLTYLKIFCYRFPPILESLSMAISVSCGQSLKQIDMSGGQNNFEPFKFSTLHRLFKFTSLHSLNIATEQSRCPTDEDIQSMAKSWPNLHTFNVNPYLDDGYPSSPPTLASLLYLIEQCTHLMNVSLTVNATDVPKSPSPISRPGLAIKIDSRNSPIGCAKLVADCLALALPEANIICPDYDKTRENCRLWREAISLWEYFIKFQRVGEQRGNKRIQEL